MKAGFYLGSGLCVYTTLMWLTGLDTAYLKQGQYLDILILALPFSIIFYSFRKILNEQPLTTMGRIVASVVIGFISYLFYSPFLFVYHNFINPTWFDSVLLLKEQDLIQKNFSSIDIEYQLKHIKILNDQHNNMFNLSSFLSSVIILPVIISLASLIFIRNKVPNKSKPAS